MVSDAGQAVIRSQHFLRVRSMEELGNNSVRDAPPVQLVFFERTQGGSRPLKRCELPVTSVYRTNVCKIGHREFMTQLFASSDQVFSAIDAQLEMEAARSSITALRTAAPAPAWSGRRGSRSFRCASCGLAALAGGEANKMKRLLFFGSEFIKNNCAAHSPAA